MRTRIKIIEKIDRIEYIPEVKGIQLDAIKNDFSGWKMLYLLIPTSLMLFTVSYVLILLYKNHFKPIKKGVKFDNIKDCELFIDEFKEKLEQKELKKYRKYEYVDY